MLIHQTLTHIIRLMSLDDKLLECIRYFYFRRGRLTYKYQV